MLGSYIHSLLENFEWKKNWCGLHETDNKEKGIVILFL